MREIRPGELLELVADVVAPWDEYPVATVVYLRHRLAGVPHFRIARHYGTSEAAVRRSLQRLAASFGLRSQEDLLTLAWRDGVRPAEID